MIDEIKKYIDTLDEQTMQRFIILYGLILESTSREIEEKLWAKLPSIYSGKNFVRLIPFRDHINIEAKEIMAYQDKLQGYKITPKGMLQLGHTQEVPRELLKLIFQRQPGKIILIGHRRYGKTILAREFVSPGSINNFDLEDPLSLALFDQPMTAL